MAKEIEKKEVDVKSAIKDAMAEIKAEQKEKEASEIDVKSMVQEMFAEMQSEVKTIAPVVAPIVKELALNAQYNKTYSSLIGYKDSEVDQAFDDGMWFKAAILREKDAQEYCETKALTTQTDGSGAYTVPDQLINRIIILSNKYGIIRQNARVWPATRGVMQLPKSGTFSTATFTLENIDKTESDPAFDRVDVNIKKLAVVTKIPMELIQDSVIDIISYVVDNMARAIALKEDQVGFYGDGTASSGSITGITPAIEAVAGNLSIVNDAAAVGWDGIVRADFNKVMGRLNESAWEEGDVKWYCSNGFYHNVMNKVKGDGQGNSITDIEKGFTKQFMGYEVATTSIFPATNDGADPSSGVGTDYCLFGSMKTVMAFADRMAKTVKSTTEGAALIANQTWLVTEQRYGLTVHDQGSATAAGSMILLQGS